MVTIQPFPPSICIVNDIEVTEPCRLAQGAVIMLGGHKFRFNHPAEAAVLRERRRNSEAGLLCSSSELSSHTTYSRTVKAGDPELSDAVAPRQRLEEQQHYVECLREEIQTEQRRAEKELEREQAHLCLQRSEIEQWILQEKQHLADIREKGMLESAVQTDIVPLPVLPAVSQKPLNDGEAGTVCLSLIVRVRKKVVQEELLKHHALRRAENRIRHKRLQYQLERIARKRHLLEAKRELQRLENAFPLVLDGPSSPELGSPSKCRERPNGLRRHSFSAELLSRLYPQHTPIYSQFLRRNRSSESTSSLSGFTCPRKWVSDEFLPVQKTRARSNTMPASCGTSKRVGSSDNLKTLQTVNGQAGGMERKTLASKSDSSVCIHRRDHNISLQCAMDCNCVDTRKVLPIIKQLNSQKCSSKGGKAFPHGGSKGLETIRKALSRSVGSGIKTVLSRVFRKPPLGLRGGRGTKSAIRLKSHCVVQENKDKVMGEMEIRRHQKSSIKTAVSCEGLENHNTIEDKKQRRWHSAETLSNKTEKWVRMQQELTGCVENVGEEEINGSSDCDSIFSVDSLSSAYATALAEQLRQDECAPSEAESEDSQMSKDSLVMESSGKQITAKPALKSNHSLSNSFRTSFSFQSTLIPEKIQKSKEMPTEVFWSIQSSPKSKRQNDLGVPKTLSHASELDSRPSSNTSVKEPENVYALTDAWSSTDAADSPRSPSVSKGLLRQALHKPSQSASQNPTSLDLSGTVNESECQRSSYSDSSEGQSETFEDHTHVSSEIETNLDHFWSDSTPGSTQESTLLHDKIGLLSDSQYKKRETCITENLERHLYSSVSTDVQEKTPDSIPLEGYGVEIVVARNDDHVVDVMPGSSGCFADKILEKDTQSAVVTQTIFKEECIHSTGGKGAFMERHVNGQSSIPNYDGHHRSTESLTLDSTGHTPTVLENHNNQFFISSSEELHQPVMESWKSEFPNEAQSGLKHLYIHTEKDVNGEKILMDPGVTVLSLTNTCTQTYDTRDTKECTSKSNTKLKKSTQVANASKDCIQIEHEPVNVYKHLSSDHLKIPKRSCLEAHTPSNSAVAGHNEVVNLDHSCVNRDATKKLLPVQKDIAAGSSNGCKRENFENISEATNSSADGPIDPKIQTYSGHLMIGRGTFNDRMTGLTINEKISEVVEEHLNLSLNTVECEQINEEPETNRRPLRINTDKLNIHEVNIEGAQVNPSTICTSQISPCVHEPPIGGNTEENMASCLQEAYLLKSTPTKKEFEFQHSESVLNSNLLSPTEEDCKIDSTESTENHSHSSGTGYQNGTVVIPFPLAVMSACKQCPRFTSDSDYVNSDNIGEDEVDPGELRKSGPTSTIKACHNSTSTSTRTEACVDLAPCTEVRQETPLAGSNISEISSYAKDNTVTQVLHHVEKFITAEIHEESDKNKYVKVSKVDLTGHFQQDVSVTKNYFRNNNYLFDLDIHHQASDSERIENCLVVTVQDQPYSEHNTNTSKNIMKCSGEETKPVDLKSNTCSEEIHKEITLSKSSQASQAQVPQEDKTCIIQQFNNSDSISTLQRDHHKLQRTKILEQSKNIQGEEAQNHALYLQGQEPLVCIDFAILPNKGIHVDMRNANKPDCRSLAASEKPQPLHINPKEHPKDKIRSTEKSAGELNLSRIDPARQTHCSSSNDDEHRVKPKKYRRAHFTAPLSSSTDSTPDSSFDEIGKTRVYHLGTASRAKTVTSASGRPNIVVQNRARRVLSDHQHTSLSSVASPSPVQSKSRESHTLGAGAGAQVSVGVTMDIAKRESSLRLTQLHLTKEILKTQHGPLIHNGTVHATRSYSPKQISHEHKDLIQNKDTMLHFASSDINPFIHTRKSEELLKTVHKNQAFGSAVNISSQPSQLQSCDKHITRCCSVDNGLNIQNSPFNSHLSTYATHKGLSSTLSSVEDSKERIPTDPQLKEVCHTSFVSSNKTSEGLASDSYNDTSDLGQSSGQVDEIVLVYSSEHESQENECQGSKKCNHGTQTVMFNGDLKKNRHKRSSTQVPMPKQAHDTSTTWRSLQNMSEQLSELIVNTSDLLGNIQCMRTGDRSLKYEHPQKNCIEMTPVSPSKNCKKDGCTQTAVDICIQTEESLLLRQSKDTSKSLSVQNAKAHEVNVIVKVIGSDVGSVSKQDGLQCFRDPCENRQSFETIKSMPDLRPEASSCSEHLRQKLEASASKVLSLETVVPNQSYPTPRALTINTVDHALSNCFGVCTHSKNTSAILARDIQAHRIKLKPKISQISPDKQKLYIDRASSPILTVDVSSCSQNGKTKSAQCSSIHMTNKMHNHTRNEVSRTFENLQSKQMFPTDTKTLLQKQIFYMRQKEKACENQSVSSESQETFSEMNCSNEDKSNVYSMESMSSSGRCTQKERNAFFHGVASQESSQSVLLSPLSHNQSSSAKFKPCEVNSQNMVSTLINESYRSSILENKHRLKTSLQYQEDQEKEILSLTPSECNTDILVSINPLSDTSPPKQNQWIPEDLPMHNKFNNWSGINEQPPPKQSNGWGPRMNNSLPQSAESRHKPELLEGPVKRAREIERLRKEREQVLASVRLDLNPQQLSVELTEAKIHYGLGETDTLLKMLHSSPREDPVVSTKQQLYDRHRMCIDGLKKEREARLQNYRRARSLSPSRHTNPPNHEMGKSQRPSGLPSRRREYLQQLRQEVVEMSRVPDPARRGGQCPSDIEVLLRDYSRAREEARLEIARARERLRERTEQEKRRLQQQALAQTVKDDLRLRTRISNSTLCTGSDLSLSSGPTSGYNSSNTALLKNCTSPSIQITGVSDGLRVKTRPPKVPLKAPRAWLSAQDIHLETSSSGYELPFSSSPSSPTGRKRTFSFGSPSSLSTSYQDIADCTLTSAIAEVHLASGGNLRHLLVGKAAAGWRHQGMERGVQTFYRPSSRPTAHSFLGAVELDRPLDSLWNVICNHSKTYLYNEFVKSAWTRPLDSRTQLVYLVTDPANCQLKQPRDFCCLSTESKQEDMWVLAMQSVFEESLPRPSVDTVRGEMFPSAWIIQPSQREGQEVPVVIYLLQVDLGSPSLHPGLLNTLARKQAAVIADLDSFLSFS